MKCEKLIKDSPCYVITYDFVKNKLKWGPIKRFSFSNVKSSLKNILEYKNLYKVHGIGDYNKINKRF